MTAKIKIVYYKKLKHFQQHQKKQRDKKWRKVHTCGAMPIVADVNPGRSASFNPLNDAM